MDADPSVSAWHEAMGLSTSAILRRTQDELAEARAEAKEFRAHAELYLRQRDNALHDLAHARFQLNIEKTRRDWWQHAAKAAGVTGVCFRCTGPLLPGEDVEPQQGTTKGSFAHTTCLNPENDGAPPVRDPLVAMQPDPTRAPATWCGGER